MNSVDGKIVDSALLRWINEHKVPLEVDSQAYRALVQTIEQLGAPAQVPHDAEYYPYTAALSLMLTASCVVAIADKHPGHQRRARYLAKLIEEFNKLRDTPVKLHSVFDPSVPYAVGEKVLLPDGQVGIITGTTEHGTTGTVAPSKY